MKSRRATASAWLSILGLGLLGGCGLGENSDEVRDEARERVDLTGKFEASCQPSAVAAGRFSVLSYDIGLDTGYSFVERVFSDASCREAEHTETARGEYTLPQPLVEGTNPINFKLRELVSTPASQAAAVVLNQTAYCGFTDWQAGVERSVLGVDCGGLKFDVDATLLNSYDIRDDKLYFATPDLLKSATVEEERATSVDLKVPFEEK